MATTPDRAGAPAQALPTNATITVTITGGTTDRVTITVEPWEARVRPGDEVSWTVVGGDSIAITPRHPPPQWPFPGLPSKGKPGEPARAGQVRQNAPPQSRHPYDITVVCGTRKIVIDPEVVIRDPIPPGPGG
jgi:hypothetical protein